MLNLNETSVRRYSPTRTLHARGDTRRQALKAKRRNGVDCGRNDTLDTRVRLRAIRVCAAVRYGSTTGNAVSATSGV
jgi:hypothetical protein